MYHPPQGPLQEWPQGLHHLPLPPPPQAVALKTMHPRTKRFRWLLPLRGKLLCQIGRPLRLLKGVRVAAEAAAAEEEEEEEEEKEAVK